MFLLLGRRRTMKQQHIVQDFVLGHALLIHIWCPNLLFYFMCQHGSVYKLAFGPKAFVVVSDPIVARHILRENAFSYDKVSFYIFLAGIDPFPVNYFSFLPSFWIYSDKHHTWINFNWDMNPLGRYMSKKRNLLLH